MVEPGGVHRKGAEEADTGEFVYGMSHHPRRFYCTHLLLLMVGVAMDLLGFALKRILNPRLREM